jgi:hypothetical protein
MKRVVLTFSLMVLTAVSALRAETIYTLIMRGQIVEASDSLSSRATAAIRDGNTLYFMSLLETDADKAAQLMAASLDAAVSPRFQEEIYLRLAQYYLQKPDYLRLKQLITDYRTKWPKGDYLRQLARYEMIINEMNRDLEQALTQADRELVEYGTGEDRQWALLDQARVLRESDKKVGAQRLARKLSQERSGPGVPQAMYLLTKLSIEDGKLEDAALNLNLLRDEYPSAIGIDALESQLIGTPETVSKRNVGKAEEITGTWYTVKVGVFSNATNANEYARQFASYKVPVSVRSKVISGKSYQIVYVGKFRSFDEASKLKGTLEQQFNESYQVVAQ